MLGFVKRSPLSTICYSLFLSVPHKGSLICFEAISSYSCGSILLILIPYYSMSLPRSSFGATELANLQFCFCVSPLLDVVDDLEIPVEGR